MLKSSTITMAAVAIALGIIAPSTAEAGCGCSKPAPELAAVRPHATYPGSGVTIFGSVVAGQSYAVTFTSGITGESAVVETTAVLRRDVADGQEKAQAEVALPSLPLGPASIEVSDVDGNVVAAIADDAFTVVPAPVIVPEDLGTVFQPDFQAAVTRSGVVYISLDVSDVHLPRVFESQLQGYPLRFGHLDVVFYNTQGFLMQRLEDGMPGLFSLEGASNDDSDILRYSRHEFSTYFLSHDERQVHELDPNDPSWHLDGSRHIDHDHLLVAIVGAFDDGSTPVPGATPPFDLLMETYSLFHAGLTADEEVAISGGNSVCGGYTSNGEGASLATSLVSNDKLRVSGGALVDGTVSAADVDISGGSIVTGGEIPLMEPIEFLPVAIPSGLTDLGKVKVEAGQTLTLSTGSYLADEVVLADGTATILVDNSAGPVTLYVTGKVDAKGTFATIDANPERFAIYVAGTKTTTINSQASFSGVIYAPTAEIKVQGGGYFEGAFTARKITVSGGSSVYYDTALRGD